VPQSSDQFKAAKAAYLKESYPGDLGEVLESGSKNPTVTMSVIKPPTQRRHIFSVAIAISLTLAVVAVIGMLNHLKNPASVLHVTKSNSADDDSIPTIADTATNRHKSSSLRFTLNRLPSQKRPSTNQNRLRLFRSLAPVKKSKWQSSSKRKTATLALNSTGKMGVAKTGWWKSGAITLASRPSNMLVPRETQKNSHRAQRSSKRKFRSHRFHYDPISINRYRSS
jgi:hypothetical protein